MSERPVVGWYEWICLPDLELGPFRAKVDTGARTSCLHAHFVEPFRRQGTDWIRFGVHPEEGLDRPILEREAPLLDWRTVTDSGGHRELRPVIETSIEMAGETAMAQFTLTNRDDMKFRILLGRRFLAGRFLVDPGRSAVRTTGPEATDETGRKGVNG